ncbi:MAG: tripartite tricarboxylate transporter TctB family protein [Alphaproteobacteria bacterium]|nr:tripartite tricarboxylate transporter TctB family protein [Alphaproteobacteria bacterium]
MSNLGGTRLATFGLLAAALVGLWQSMRLESWGFDGPGAGFFPQLVAGVCVVLALIVLVSPGRAGSTEDGDTEDQRGTAETRRTFAIYAISLVVLALGAAFAGFVVTAVVVAVIIVRFAERRSWAAAIGYGVACAAVGLVCFGWLLRVDLPEGPIERAFYSLVR